MACRHSTGCKQQEHQDSKPWRVSNLNSCSEKNSKPLSIVYSIPRRNPITPQATPVAMKPIGGLIKNVPIPMNSIKEATNILATVDLVDMAAHAILAFWEIESFGFSFSVCDGIMP